MTKSRHNRVARWIFRLGVAVCVLLVAATVVSFWRAAKVSVAGGTVILGGGSVYLFLLPLEPPGVRIGPTIGTYIPWTTKTRMALPTRGGPDTMTTVYTYPTWWFLLAAMMPTVLAWRKLRRPLPGHCRKCGYDLTGNVTGKCSECGTEIDLK